MVTSVAAQSAASIRSKSDSGVARFVPFRATSAAVLLIAVSFLVANARADVKAQPREGVQANAVAIMVVSQIDAL